MLGTGKISTSFFLIFIIASLFGCATTKPKPVMDPVTKPPEAAKAAPEKLYYPKLPEESKTLEQIGADLTILLANRTRPIGIEFPNGYYKKHNLSGYSNPKGLQEIIEDIKGLDSYSFTAQTYELSYIKTKSLIVLVDRLALNSLLFFRYDDLLDSPFTVKKSSDYDQHPLISFGNSILFHFDERDRSDARKIADYLLFIQHRMKKERDDQLSLFESKAAEYRKLKVKPSPSEEQKKLTAQARVLAHLKNYAGAIDLYLKAVELDPLSCPESYLDLALLSSEMSRLNTAIFYMRKYMMLEPRPSDSPMAMEKINEWDLMLKR